MRMNEEEYWALLKKHGYQRVGAQAAVKSCLWLKKAIRGEGQCYKGKFYGISSHRCIQMTPTLMCNQRCVFCWRPVEIAPPPSGWDSPSSIADGALQAQMRLLTGYGGSPSSTDQKALDEAHTPKHVAISLAGEPTLYPYLDELVGEFASRGMTTFVVSNGTRPEMIEKISPTMLYLSLDAPDEQTYEKVCRPLSSTWGRVLESLELLGEKSCRTNVRMTLVKGLNMHGEQGYASILNSAQPDFVGLKAYMHIGFSRNRLSRDAMPTHEEVRAFASRIASLTGYEMVDESPVSRIVLLARDGESSRTISGV
ncbi:MAG: 4-demethylwyosine synthase TYW1 [Methermicoccaceae archaeon]